MKTLKVIGVALLLMVVMALVFMPFFILDKYHAQISAGFRELGFLHYFDGDVWFAVIATGLSAIPGMCFGLLALIQTRKNFVLESRYHRPSIQLNECSIKVSRIRDSSYRIDKTMSRWHLFKEYIEDIKAAGSDNMLCSFSFTFKIMNSIVIRDFIIRKMAFRIGKEEYCFLLGELSERAEALGRRCFDSNIEDGNCVYVLSQDLFPYILQKQDAGVKEKDFWDDIEYFLNYPNWQNENFYKMSLMVEAEIYYEYASHKSEKIYGYVKWNQPPGEPRVGADKEIKSCNGFFSYEFV